HANCLIRAWLACEIQRMGFLLCGCAGVAAVTTIATFARFGMNTLAIQRQNLLVLLLVAGRAIILSRCGRLGIFLVPAGLSYARSDSGGGGVGLGLLLPPPRRDKNEDLR